MLAEQIALKHDSPLTTLQLYPSDYELVLKQLVLSQSSDSYPVYYWNNGFVSIVKLSLEQNQLKYSSPLQDCSNPLAIVQQKKLPPGLYIFDNLLDFEHLTPIERSVRESQIFNCVNCLKFQLGIKIILLGEWIQLSPKLRLKTEQIQIGLPTGVEIARTLETKLSHQPPIKLISACQGLAWGDIEHELEQFLGIPSEVNSDSLTSLTQRFIELKGHILNNSELNLEYFSNPDIPRIGGNDILNKFLFDKLVKLNEPSAARYGLKPPKAMLFVGPPGTGKSLTAKMTAKVLGYTLMGMSFGDILGAENPDRVVSLLLELADSMGKVILFLDDWDKGLADWESGGPARRIVQKFLTWMQEHTSPVLTIATVNRINLLPTELLRRFDDGGIWMLDLPHRGAIFDIFNIYLAQCFPNQFTNPSPESVENTPWTFEQWVELIDEAEECTPVEISDVVNTCLADWYCSLSANERIDGNLSAILDFDYLLTKVKQIDKASVRAADSIQQMRNDAWFAKPASSQDSSPFRLEEEPLLGGGIG